MLLEVVEDRLVKVGEREKKLVCEPKGAREGVLASFSPPLRVGNGDGVGESRDEGESVILGVLLRELAAEKLPT